MRTSLFEIFKIGIGPSSSHTVGPMRAAADFLGQLLREGVIDEVKRVQIDLYGSLALTGRGHGTDRAVMLGLSGEVYDRVDPDAVPALISAIGRDHRLHLSGSRDIPFDESRDIVFHRGEQMPDHPNGLRFHAYDAEGAEVARQGYYSIGGGAIVKDGARYGAAPAPLVAYPFESADQLLEQGDRYNLAIWQIALENEKSWHDEAEVRAWVMRVWEAMQACVRRGLSSEGVLPGPFKVQRRAPHLARRLSQESPHDPLAPMDWVNVYAMAVNEENAAGGRVVTAPTNGAAGIIPAVATYYMRFVPQATEDGLFRYFLTAAVIGTLYKENASISGADVGCQGEVGVASSMAAGGLVAALGGNNHQVEKAAEIAMEHNLGMTCDPVGGLVQIPCIERNAMGAVKALNACRVALLEGSEHKVSLDQVIATMLQTGKDMQSRYKETSLGGLAVNVIEC